MTIHPFVLAACVAGLACGGCQPGPAAPGPNPGPSTAEIIARAPTVQILLDNSRSSPALDQAIMDAVTPRIVAAVKTMSPGTVVSVNTVGDATVTTALLSMRIAARGTTASDVARKLEHLLRGFPAQMKGHEQDRSDLVGGFAAAAAAINPQSEANAIYVVSDLVEYSTVADCIRATRCRLPRTPLFDLAQAQVHVYGVGQGLPSERAMHLTQEWKTFLVRANAKDPDLRRF